MSDFVIENVQILDFRKRETIILTKIKNITDENNDLIFSQYGNKYHGWNYGKWINSEVNRESENFSSPKDRGGK